MLPGRFAAIIVSMTAMTTTAHIFRTAAILIAAAGTPAQAATNAELVEQVRAAETAFARTMADRDHRAFTAFLAKDAVFLNGPNAMRGAEAVAAGWKRLYEGAQAGFSWAPETVVVLESGSLALSTGPVHDPSGKRTGTFNSVWRREKDGRWKVVFDKGCPPCDCGN